MLLLDLQHESIEQGKRLKATRKLTLLSRRSFAIKHQFNVSSYQAWEDGKYKKGISLANAEKIVQAFSDEHIDCSIEWLLNGNNKAAIRKNNMQHSNSANMSKNCVILSAINHKKIKALNNKLIEAIKRNNVVECRYLIESGANLHKLKKIDLYLFSFKRFSALHFAAWYGGPLLIQMFVELGISPNIRNRDYDTPLHLAAYEGGHEAIQKLHNLGASIGATNKEGTTPLMWAAQTGRPAIIAYLISLGSDVNYTDFNGNTAAHWAAFHGNHTTRTYALTALP